MSALNPGGVRIGTPAMTSRGLKEKDFEQIADFLNEVSVVSDAIFPSSLSLSLPDLLHGWAGLAQTLEM